MAASLPFQGCDKPALNTDDAPEQWIGGKRPCRAAQLKEQQWRQRRTKGLPAAPLGVLSECLEDCEEWAASESGEEFALACWACSACTLLNAAARARCGACGGAAPAREGRPDRAAAPHGGAALERGEDPAAWPSLGESVDTAWARCEVSSVGASSWLEVEDEQELAGWLDADGAALDDGEGSCASFLVVAGAPAAEDPAPAAAEVPPSWAARAAAGARAGARVPAPSVRVPPLRRPAPRRGAAPAGGAGQGGECQPDALDQLEERRMRPAGLRGRRGRCRESAMNGNLDALTTIFTEFYYWVTVVFMFLIHVGFCMYEVGASRRRNHMHTLMKNVMVIPLVTVTFFFFGWWIYWAFPMFPFFGGLNHEMASANLPWSPNMATNLDDRITGVFWAAFLLFSWTAASIVSGSVIERIRSSALWVHAVLIGSVWWIIDAAWGWHYDGWMVKYLGYHDAYASGVIHAIAGGYALGVIMVLGPRIGKFAADGTPRDIPPHNPWMLTIGIFLIYTGFWGFYAACNVPLISPEVIGGQITGTTWTATNIYLAPTSLSAITFNFLMSLSGGLMAAYVVSKGDAFWTFSGGLAGIITASAGNDLYHPVQAMLVGAVGVVIVYKLHFWVERRFKLDDAVGAVAVHGYSGVVGLIIAGFLLWGAPSSPFEGYATINPLGQTLGAVIMFFCLGFLPAFIVAKMQAAAGVLRIPVEVELQGLDYAEHHAYEDAIVQVIEADKAYLNTKPTPAE